MIRARFVVTLIVCLWPAVSFSSVAIAHNESPQDTSPPIIFFDVSDLPARIDEPKFQKTAKGYVLKCAVAKRSGEQLLGLRLILLIVEPSGKLRSRVTWTQATDLPGYSINTFTLNPEITAEVRATD